MQLRPEKFEYAFVVLASCDVAEDFKTLHTDAYLCSAAEHGFFQGGDRILACQPKFHRGFPGLGGRSVETADGVLERIPSASPANKREHRGDDAEDVSSAPLLCLVFH